MESKELKSLEEIMEKMRIRTDQLRDEAVFFTPDLPMDSLHFIRLLVELENAFQIEIDVSEISKAGSITYGRLKTYIFTHRNTCPYPQSG